MRCDTRIFLAALAISVFGNGPSVDGAILPVTNWAAIVGASTISNAGTNSPTFAPADVLQVAGGFPTVTLADGDSIAGRVKLTITRSGTGGMSDNLRFGLFREVGGGNPTTGDGTGYSGISVALQNALREHRNPARAQPFSSGGTGAPLTIVTPAGVDPEGDTITEADVTLDLFMKITRDGNALDIVGSISDGTNYKQSFSVDNRALDTSFTTDVYSWNRMAFLFGDAVNGTSVVVSNARILIPEPAAALLLGIAMTGVFNLAARRRARV